MESGDGIGAKSGIVMKSPLMIFSLLLLSSLLLHQVQGLYFLVNEEQKCFSFEQPRDTPLVFAYELLDEGGVVGFDLYYGDKADLGQQIMHKVFSEVKGHIDFTTDVDGNYLYCLQSPPQTHAAPIRLQLQVQYGFDNDHYKQLVEKYNYDAINLMVHRMNDLLTLTLNEADYQKHKETEFHEETVKMNNAALWWPVLQIAILIFAGIYQVQHLKNFFKANKFI